MKTYEGACLEFLGVNPFECESIFLLGSACAVYVVVLCNLCAESLLVCLSVSLVEHHVCVRPFHNVYVANISRSCPMETEHHPIAGTFLWLSLYFWMPVVATCYHNCFRSQGAEPNRYSGRAYTLWGPPSEHSCGGFSVRRSHWVWRDSHI